MGLGRGQAVLALGPAGKQVPAALVEVNEKLLVAHAQLGQGFGEGRGHGGNLRYWPVTTEAGQGCFASKPGKGLVGPGRPGPEPAERAEAAGGR